MIKLTQLAPTVYVALIDGKVRQFDSEEEGNKAITIHEKGEEFRNLARSFCVANKLEGKNAQGKINIIVDFLSWAETVDVDDMEAIVEQPETTAHETKVVEPSGILDQFQF